MGALVLVPCTALTPTLYQVKRGGASGLQQQFSSLSLCTTDRIVLATPLHPVSFRTYLHLRSRPWQASCSSHARTKTLNSGKLSHALSLQSGREHKTNTKCNRLHTYVCHQMYLAKKSSFSDVHTSPKFTYTVSRSPSEW